MSSEIYFQGKKFISSKRAALLCEYSQDYVGQLIRSKKIQAKMIGRAWYVSERSILNYKNTAEEVAISASRAIGKANVPAKKPIKTPFVDGVLKQGVGRTEKVMVKEVAQRVRRVAKTPSRMPGIIEDLLTKAIASTLAVSLVLGGYQLSDTQNLLAAQKAVESVGQRMSLAIDDSVARIADALNVVGGAYLASLDNAGKYAVLGFEGMINASRELASSYVGAVEDAGLASARATDALTSVDLPAIARAIKTDGINNISLAAVSLASDPLRYGFETAAIGVYEAINPLFDRTSSFIAGIFSPREDVVIATVPSAKPSSTTDPIASVAPATNGAASGATSVPASQPSTTQVSQYYSTIGLTQAEVSAQIAAAQAVLEEQIGQAQLDALRANANARGSSERRDSSNIDRADIDRSSITASTISSSTIANSNLVGTTTATNLDVQNLTADTITFIDSVTVNSTTTNSVISSATTTNLFTTNLTSQNAPRAPYFIATDANATSTFAGGLTVAGSTGVTVSQTGRLGIGTNAPNASLEIVQATNGTTIISGRRATDVAPTGDFIEYLSADGNSVLFRVDNSGNLLAGGIINTGSQTITATSTPQFRIQYDASNELTTSVSPQGATTLAVSGSNPSLAITPQINGSSTFSVTNASSTAVLSVDTNTETVTVTNLLASTGIIASATTTNLYSTNLVASTISAGSISATGTLAVSGDATLGAVTFTAGTSTGAFSAPYFTATGSTATSTFAGALAVGGSRLFVGTDGNVGVGTTSPSNRLGVVGSGYFAGDLTAAGITATGTLTVIGTNLSMPTDGAAIRFANSGSNGTLQALGGVLTLANSAGTSGSDSLVISTPASGRQLSLRSDVVRVSDRNNASEYARFTSTGLGIGTTTPVNALSVSVNAASQAVMSLINTNSTGFAGVDFYNNAGTASGALFYANSGAGVLPDSMSIGPRNSTAAFNVITGTGLTPRITVLAGGNVGIGTTTPNTKLNVVATGNESSARFVSANQSMDGIQIQSTASNGYSTVGFLSSTGAAVGSFGYGNSGSVQPDRVFFNSNGKTMGFSTNNGSSNTLTITTGGNVGIGTSSPSQRLSVEGNGHFAGNLVAANVTATGTITTSGFSLTGNVIDVSNTLQIRRSSGSANSSVSFIDSGASISGRIGTGGSDSLVFSSGNGATEYGRFSSVGNFGIGTTTPVSKLDVYGVGEVARFGDSTNSNTYIGMAHTLGTTPRSAFGYNAVSGNAVVQGALGKGIEFNVNNNTFGSGAAMTVTSAGNVGIGTTTPSGKLEVLTSTLNSSIVLNDVGTNDPGVKFYRTNGSGSYLPYVIQNTVTGESSLGDLVFRSGSSVVAKGTETLTTRMILTSSGNLGVGTTTPSAKLHVNQGTASSVALQLDGQASGGARLLFSNSEGGNYFISDNNKLYFGKSTTVAAVNDLGVWDNSTGNLGIGTTSPSSRLTVEGTAGATGGIQLNATTGTANRYAVYPSGGSSTIFQNLAGGVTAFNGSSAEIMRLNEDGKVGIGTTSPSERLSVTGNGLFSGSLVSASLSVTGNVGIGTTTPVSKLTVVDGTGGGTNNSMLSLIRTAGNANDGATLSLGGTVGGKYNAIRGLSDGRLAFFTNHTSTDFTGITAQMIILSNGDVGIGTSTPGARLTVSGGNIQLDNNRGIEFANSVGTKLAMVSYDSTNHLVLGNANGGSAGTVINAGGGGLADIGFNVGPAASRITSMYLNGAGNVGIGTTTPTRLLSVNGNAQFGDSSVSTPTASPLNVSFGATYGSNTPGSTGNLKWDMFTNSVTGNRYGIGMSANLMEYQAGVTGSHGFFVNQGTEIMRISTNGNVGVGTTTPRARLSVTGGGLTTGLAFQVANSADSPKFTILDNGSVGIGTANPEQNLSVVDTSTSTRVSIGHNGGTSFGAGNVSSTYSQLSVVMGVGQTIASDPYPFQVLNSSGTRVAGVRTDGMTVSNILSTTDVSTAAMNQSSNYSKGFLLNNTGQLVWSGNSNWWGTPDVGLSRISAGVIGIGNGTQGSATGTLSVGNLGIGTTSPTARLTVKGSGTGTGVSFNTLDSNGTSRFTVLDNGSVGLNVASPSALLDVAGSNTTTDFRISRYGNPSSYMYMTAVGGAFTQSTFGVNGSPVMSIGGGVGIGSYSGGGTSLPSNGLAVSGNVGIGTTTPSNRLEVSGSSYFGGDATFIAPNGGIKTATFGSFYGLSTEIGIRSSSNFGIDIPSTGTFRVTKPTAVSLFSVDAATNNSYFATNVGIGTTTPDGKLTVYKTGSGSSSVGLTVHDAVNPTYSANADNLFTVRGTGSSATTWRGRITAGGDNRAFLMGEYNSQAWLGAHTANLAAWADLYINPDGTTQSTYIGDMGGGAAAPVPILTVSNALGNVGIGTTTPAAKLAIVGDVLASYFNATSTTATSTFAGGFDVANGAIRHDWASGATTIQNLELGNMSFESDSGIVTWVDMPVTAASSAGTKQSYTAGINGNPLLTVYAESDGAGGIQNSGVGIGTSTPLAKLDIWGNFRVSTSSVESTPLVFADTGTGKFGLGTSSPTAQLHTTGTVRFSNFGSGSLQTDASGNVSVSSDERLKDIEGSFSRGLADIVKINPILYKWNATSGLDMVDLYAGFSAQNIEIAIPEAVGVSPNGYLSLNDRPILATAVNAIKELNLSVASTTARILSVEQRVATLEATLASIGSGSQTTIINATTSASSTVEAVSSWLASLGVAIENAVARFATVIADVVTTKKLTVGDSSNLAAAGITIFDRATGAPVCMYIENGVMKSEPGECGVVEVPEPAPVPASTPDPEPIPDSTPVVEEPAGETGGETGTTTPDQVPAEEGGSEPEPTPEQTPVEEVPVPEAVPEEVVPEPTPEPTPEPSPEPVATE